MRHKLFLLIAITLDYSIGYSQVINRTKMFGNIMAFLISTTSQIITFVSKISLALFKLQCLSLKECVFCRQLPETWPENSSSFNGTPECFRKTSQF